MKVAMGCRKKNIAPKHILKPDAWPLSIAIFQTKEYSDLELLTKNRKLIFCGVSPPHNYS